MTQHKPTNQPTKYYKFKYDQYYTLYLLGLVQFLYLTVYQFSRVI